MSYARDALDQAERERQWEEEYRHFEAARELRRARIKSLVRMISMAFRPARRFSDGARGFIPIDHIVGMIDEETGRRSALRLSGRGIARQWDRLFNQDNHDACPSLTVLRNRTGLVPDGWSSVPGPAGSAAGKGPSHHLGHAGMPGNRCAISRYLCLIRKLRPGV